MIGMFQASVPPSILALQSLDAILSKAAQSAETRRIDPAVLLNSRIAPDMFPLTRQVQIACDMAKSGCARLAAATPPSFPDTETTIPELQARISATIAFLRTLTPDAIDGGEARIVSMKMRGETVQFAGLDYLLQFLLPNLYFHAAAAYMILRHNGVDVGKRDYLGTAKN